MRVRMMHGSMAGEVQEVPYHIAKVLLADGRARLPDDPVGYETRPAAVMAEPTQVRVGEEQPRRGKKHGRERV